MWDHRFLPAPPFCGHGRVPIEEPSVPLTAPKLLTQFKDSEDSGGYHACTCTETTDRNLAAKKSTTARVSCMLAGSRSQYATVCTGSLELRRPVIFGLRYQHIQSVSKFHGYTSKWGHRKRRELDHRTKNWARKPGLHRFGRHVCAQATIHRGGVEQLLSSRSND